jgi:ABC-type transporter Mla subunit MlaD
MISRTQKVRLAIFLSATTLLLLGTIIFLAGSRLIEKRDNYYSRFTISVNGLNAGSPVKYNGIQVGRVEKIRVDPTNVSVSIVDISVDAGTPIKVTSRAVVNSLGITGLKYIDLMGSTNESKTIKPGSEIPEGQSLMDNLTGKATDIALKVEMLLANMIDLTTGKNREYIASTLQKIESTSTQIDMMVEANGEKIAKSMESLGKVLVRMDKVMGRIDSIIAQNQPTVEDSLKHLNTVIKKFEGIETNAEKLLISTTATVNHFQEILAGQDLKGSVAETNKLIHDLNLLLLHSRENFQVTIENVRQATENINDFSRLISENPSILLRKNEMLERKIQ